MINPTPADIAHENHIRDLNDLMCAAMQRYEASRNPKQRAEALRLQGLHRQAMAERSPAQKARIEAEIQDRMQDEGVNFFAAQGEMRAAELRAAA